MRTDPGIGSGTVANFWCARRSLLEFVAANIK